MSQEQKQTWAGQTFPIQVMEFSRERCPFSNRDHTWRQFHVFRNAILDILSRYGTVGPTGKMRILDADEESTPEPGASTKADFFVVDDDMYGLSVRVEASWSLAKPVLFEELAMFLKTCQEWCVYFALIKGGLFVFHNLIMHEGAFFAGCVTVEELYQRCAAEPDVEPPLRKSRTER